MTNLAKELRAAMRRGATGVTVVSSRYEGVEHGMTVSSFTSLSLEPPYVLVSLERNTRTHELVMKSGLFGVSVLSEDQQDVSDHCATGQTEIGERFANFETFNLTTGVPFLAGGLAFFDCRVAQKFDAGTHSVFVGEVVALKEGAEAQPLIYFNQGYRKIS